MREYGFSLTRILPYKDRILESHILCSVLSLQNKKVLNECKINLVFFYKETLGIKPTNEDQKR